MGFFQCILILFYGLTALRPVTSCSMTNRKREDRALKECLSFWDVYTDTYVIDLQTTLFDANITRVCQADKLEEADHCVTTVPVDTCSSVLLFWRHFVDPINQACANFEDFTSSLACLDQKKLAECKGITYDLDLYSRRKSVRSKHCQTILKYKACMIEVIRNGSGCEGEGVGPLRNAVGLHLLHLGGYYKCSQDFQFDWSEKTLQSNPDKPLIMKPDFFD
ncbi:uncharacterized protein LOC111122999 [Crassostrea virginica]